MWPNWQFDPIHVQCLLLRQSIVHGLQLVCIPWSNIDPQWSQRNNILRRSSFRQGWFAWKRKSIWKKLRHWSVLLHINNEFMFKFSVHLSKSCHHLHFVSLIQRKFLKRHYFTIRSINNIIINGIIFLGLRCSILYTQFFRDIFPDYEQGIVFSLFFQTAFSVNFISCSFF